MSIPAEDRTPDEGYGLTDAFIAAVEAAIDDGHTIRVKDLAAQLTYADLADLLEMLGSDHRGRMLDMLGPDIDFEALTELDDAIKEEALERLGTAELAAAVTELDSDDALELVEDLDEERQQELLEAVKPEERALLEAGLAYPEDSAGRLMQRELVAVPSFFTVGETIDYLRETEDLPKDFYDIFVVDPRHQPIGTVPLSHVLRTKRPVQMNEITEESLYLIDAETDQEDVAYLFRQQDLVSAPVVDAAGRLVGVITVDDVVDVIDEEHEEDLMKLGGVGETDLYDAVVGTVKSRFSWLLVNLATAILASVVIGLFDDAIDRLVALAVLMPIVASMGGNAGTQTLTVAVRALAMKDLTSSNAGRVLGKEIVVGAVNGVLLAIVTGAVAGLWFGNPAIGGIIGAAMIINMIVAALSGVTIPLALDRLNIDPALASGVFLTTVTDVIGFFAFLGLAVVFIL